MSRAEVGMAMRFDAAGGNPHSACPLLDLDRRCGFGGAGRQSDWERVRSGADRALRQRERQGRRGRKREFVRRGSGVPPLLRHF